MTNIFNQSGQLAKRRILRNRMTRAELKLWFYLKSRQVEGLKFRRQYGIGPYITDFYCPSAKLVIEVDGDSHTGSENQENDIIRQKNIEALGIRVVRFTDLQVMQDIENVIEEIIRWTRPPLTPPSQGGE